MPEINSVAGQLVGIPVGQVYTAGPGIKIDNVNKVVSVDETVLWEVEGTPTAITSDTNLTLSESVFNFKRVKIYYLQSYGTDTSQSSSVEAMVMSNTFQVGVYPTYGDSVGNMCLDQNAFSFLTTTPTTCTVRSGTKRVNTTSGGVFSTTSGRGIKPLLIVGIHRIAGGN